MNVYAPVCAVLPNSESIVYVYFLVLLLSLLSLVKASVVHAIYLTNSLSVFFN